VLMAVQFPGDLRISNLLEVEIFHLEPRFAPSLLAMHGVGMPSDLRAIIQIFVALEIEAVGADLFRVQDDVIRLGR